MGFLKKFLVEEIPQETENYDESYDIYEEEIEADVNTENVSQENLVTDIYNQNELSDLSKSIFKIEEVINSLPKEMPNETKKATVLSMLPIFGLTVDEVVGDGANRLSIIKSALASIIDENDVVINNNNRSIEQKKVEIQELERDNSERATLIKNTEDKIEFEAKRIADLIKFVGGEV